MSEIASLTGFVFSAVKSVSATNDDCPKRTLASPAGCWPVAADETGIALVETAALDDTGAAIDDDTGAGDETGGGPLVRGRGMLLAAYGA